MKEVAQNKCQLSKAIPTVWRNFSHNSNLHNLFIYKKVNIKVKVTLEQATKVQRGSRYIALLFLLPLR